MFSRIMGIFRATVRDVSESDMNTVVHKSCALIAQTFMLAMAEEKYDTCPLEGFDAWKIKKTIESFEMSKGFYSYNMRNS